MIKRISKITVVLLTLLLIFGSVPVHAAAPFDIAEDLQPVLRGTSYLLTVSYASDSVKEDIVWTSDDPSIATVSSNGQVLTKKDGLVTITANYKNGVHIDTVQINVLPSVNRVWGKKNGYWYLYNGTYTLKGWQKVSNIWYYMDESGIMQTGWLKDKETWYLLGTSGAMLTGWQYIEDAKSWYYMKESGAMQTGWLYYKDKWYYLKDSGAMATGWVKVNGTWYLMNDSGAMLTGWQLVDGEWYLLSDSGAMLTGWQKRGETWYFMNPSGKMLTGWQQINGSWYYLNPASGAMLTGWQYIGDRWYYMSSSGARMTGWQYINGYWYLLGDNGWMLTGWQQFGDIWYYLQPGSGRMATETCYVEGYPQVFKTNGVWISTGAMDTKANYGTDGSGYKSNTDYLILVNLTDKVTKIYKKSGSQWIVDKAWLCTVGDSSKGWTTATGEFYIGQHTGGYSYTRGPSFNDSEGHTLYYWTRFYNDFLFHSILYDGGTYNVSTDGNALGEELSHGCVRLRIENAQWIYDNIPDGTKVVVYYY